MGSLDPQMLASAIDAARAAWPGVDVAADVFAAWLEARLEPGQPLSSLKTTDLYLACACAANDARALRHFEEQLLPEVDRSLGRLAMAGSVDETKQILRSRFFVADREGAAPRIAAYSGRGDLRSWVRASAVRAALRVVERPKGQVDVDSSVMRAVASPGADLETEYLKRRYSAEFEGALRDAYAALPTRDRNVVRYYYGEGLGIDAIASLHRVHRSTAARWVNRITDDLLAETRRSLTQRLSANRAEISSIVRMIQSRIEVALRAVVADETPHD